MKSLRILHITPWFPNENNPVNGIFILEHIKSLAPCAENHVYHIQFGKVDQEIEIKIEDISVIQKTLKPIVNKWWFKEKKVAKFVAETIANSQDDYDLVNFHIAYPNAIKIGDLKQAYPSLKFVITEHWSAYHENFNLLKGNKGRTRIESIFHHDIPLITVSTALKQDIENFSGKKQSQSFIIPNVIDTDLFYYRPPAENNLFTFVSINNWNPMKNPFVLIEAFAELYKNNKQIRLILGGAGSLMNEMLAMVARLELNDVITFKPNLSKSEVADTLSLANAYVQSSNYETFSVICAEALACGVPVIVSKMGGPLDFVDQKNGILVDDLSICSWTEALETMLVKRNDFDGKKIANEAAQRFNKSTVGKAYFNSLTQILDAK